MSWGKLRNTALAALAFGLSGTPALAQDAVTLLADRLTAAIEAAARADRPIMPAVNGIIETSGAEPDVVAEAIRRLLQECPAGEVLRALTDRQRQALPAWCDATDMAGLQRMRELSLAEVGQVGDATGSVAGANNTTGPTGAVGGGGGLPALASAGFSASPTSAHVP